MTTSTKFAGLMKKDDLLKTLCVISVSYSRQPLCVSVFEHAFDIWKSFVQNSTL